MIAGWSSLVARRAHNPKVGGSNPSPATIKKPSISEDVEGFLVLFNNLVLYDIGALKIKLFKNQAD